MTTILSNLFNVNNIKPLFSVEDYAQKIGAGIDHYNYNLNINGYANTLRN